MGRLRSAAADAARSAKGPDAALTLSDVRGTDNKLVLRVARAPAATLGQRLYAARYRCELTAGETANAAGVSVNAVTAAEADRLLDPGSVAALEALIARLSGC